MSGIDSVVTHHFEMLFRNMAYEFFDKIVDVKRFCYKFVVFVPVVVKCYVLTVIGFYSGRSNNRSAEISTDIFDNLVGLAIIWFRINVKSILVLLIAKSFDFFERSTNVFFKKI